MGSMASSWLAVRGMLINSQNAEHPVFEGITASPMTKGSISGSHLLTIVERLSGLSLARYSSKSMTLWSSRGCTRKANLVWSAPGFSCLPGLRGASFWGDGFIFSRWEKISVVSPASSTGRVCSIALIRKSASLWLMIRGAWTRMTLAPLRVGATLS